MDEKTYTLEPIEPLKHSYSFTDPLYNRGDSEYRNIDMNRKFIGQFRLGEKLGQGTFGIVVLGTHQITGEKVAVKILDKEKILQETDKSKLEREIKILKKMRHNNIVHLYDVKETRTCLYIIMEYINGKELFEYITEKGKLDEIESCKYYQQIISGIEYLGKIKVVHRDIKPENLLLDENDNIKIVDFGLSNEYPKNELLSTACGSPCYAAPEMINGDKYNGLKTDIWSSGIVLYAMLCGYLPFEEESNEELYKKIIEGKFDTPKFLSKDAKDFLHCILNTNPKKRFTIQQMHLHPWFNQVDSKINMTEGLLLNKIVVPIDENIISEMVNKYNFNGEEIRSGLLLNEHNNITTTYYLILNKKIRNGEKSISDMKSKEFLSYIKNKNNYLEHYKYNFGKILKERIKGKIIKNSGNELTSQSTGINKENEINNSNREKSAEKLTHIISDKSMKYRFHLKEIKNEKGLKTDRQKQYNNDKINTNLKKKQGTEEKKNNSVENRDNKKNKSTIRSERKKKNRDYSKSITSNKKVEESEKNSFRNTNTLNEKKEYKNELKKIQVELKQNTQINSTNKNKKLINLKKKSITNRNVIRSHRNNCFTENNNNNNYLTADNNSKKNKDTIFTESNQNSFGIKPTSNITKNIVFINKTKTATPKNDNTKILTHKAKAKTKNFTNLLHNMEVINEYSIEKKNKKNEINELMKRMKNNSKPAKIVRDRINNTIIQKKRIHSLLQDEYQKDILDNNTKCNSLTKRNIINDYSNEKTKRIPDRWNAKTKYYSKFINTSVSYDRSKDENKTPDKLNKIVKKKFIITDEVHHIEESDDSSSESKKEKEIDKFKKQEQYLKYLKLKSKHRKFKIVKLRNDTDLNSYEKKFNHSNCINTEYNNSLINHKISSFKDQKPHNKTKKDILNNDIFNSSNHNNYYSNKKRNPYLKIRILNTQNNMIPQNQINLNKLDYYNYLNNSNNNKILGGLNTERNHSSKNNCITANRSKTEEKKLDKSEEVKIDNFKKKHLVNVTQVFNKSVGVGALNLTINDDVYKPIDLFSIFYLKNEKLKDIKDTIGKELNNKKIIYKVYKNKFICNKKGNNRFNIEVIDASEDQNLFIFKNIKKSGKNHIYKETIANLLNKLK